MTSLSEFLRGCDKDFESYGFDRAEFLALLGVIDGAMPTVVPTATKWERGLYLQEWFTINEAVLILEGYHPDELEDWPAEYWPREFVSIARALLDSLQELDVHPEDAGDIYGDPRVRHKSIKAWCERRGVLWPLFLTMPHAATTRADPELGQRLAAVEMKAERLERELAAMFDERDRLQQDVQNLAAELQVANKRAATAENIAHALKAQLADQQDTLATQGRNSALVIMAALAKEARIDITQPRKAGEILSGVVTDLGGSLTGRGISNWLKDIPAVFGGRAIQGK